MKSEVTPEKKKTLEEIIKDNTSDLAHKQFVRGVCAGEKILAVMIKEKYQAKEYNISVLDKNVYKTINELSQGQLSKLLTEVFETCEKALQLDIEHII